MGSLGSEVWKALQLHSSAIKSALPSSKEEHKLTPNKRKGTGFTLPQELVFDAF